LWISLVRGTTTLGCAVRLRFLPVAITAGDGGARDKLKKRLAHGCAPRYGD